jgi:lysophospholipase L1-like esterase
MPIVRSRLWGAGAVVASLIALGLPSISRAACGGTLISHPAHHRAQQAPPLALGDSTMLLSLPGLAHDGFEANAHGCRQYFQALDMLRQMRASGTLPHMVVLALGANGDVTGTDIGETLGVLGRHRLLVLMTPRELGGGSGPDAATERAEARRHLGRILLLDWVRFSAGHASWFAPDGLHLNPPGVDAFTALISRAYPYAYVPCPLTGGHRRRIQRALDRRRVRVRRDTGPAAAAIGLRASAKRKGYIGATITGPAGTRIELGERVGSRTTPLGPVIRLPVSGKAVVPRATTWLCARRFRTLVATTLPPAVAATASSTVKTPSCSHRLVVRVSRKARVGRSISVRLTDRWGLGGLPVRVCLAPPGAATDCRARPLATGQPRRSISLATPRPGGWNVKVATPYGQRIKRQVWATHPGGRIHVLLDGDSEMQILDTFIGQQLSPHGVSTSSDAQISTGLTNSTFYDWQAQARRQAASLRPDVSIVIMGANDGFGTVGPGGTHETCCGPGWSAGYANLAAEMMRTLLRGNAGRVYWFLLPTPRPGNFKSVFDGVNRGIKAAAARFPGRVALIDANTFFTPGDRYRDFMSFHGSGFTIHEADGIHLSASADRVAAALVRNRLRADRVIR